MKCFIYISVLFLIVLSSCIQEGTDRSPIIVQQKQETLKNVKVKSWEIENTAELEKRIISEGLVDIQQIDSTILVDLKYSTYDNFLCADLYGDLTNCYLQPDVAEKLRTAQQYLRNKFPYYSLIIFDAVRPRSIQIKMWDTLKVAANERSKFVSNPYNGSLHNFGAAVDLSIIDKNGVLFDMGTPYDYFGELAYPREEFRMLKEGRLTYKQFFNRKILRDIMLQAGFVNITTEWWHFNSCSRAEAFAKYKIIE